MNTIMIIYPYKYENLWVFDDEKIGLIQEPFISGTDIILDQLTQETPNAENGFILLFSAMKFPGYQEEFYWLKAEHGGNWYQIKSLDIEGWLCPAMFKYFENTPEQIFVQIKSKI